MLNVRTTLWRIFGILFIFSISFTAFAQQAQQAGAALSQSQFERILEKIEESEDEMRKHVDKRFDELDKKFDEKFDKLDKKFDELDGKFNELDKQVAVLNTNVDILIAIIVGIFTLVVAPILVIMLVDRLKQRNSAKRAAEVPAESREVSDEDSRQRNSIDNQQSKFA